MANKTAKQTTEKAELNQKLEQLKTTAKTLNSQLREVATEVVDTVVENSKQMAEETTTRVKTLVEKASVENSIKTVKTTAKSINDYTLEVAEDIVAGTLEAGKSWQGVGEKALKGTLKLANKQQEILFTALEEVKGQVVDGAKRVRTLVTGNNN
ncbi:MAG: hypothetical protein DA408_07845 [Bacteroidetes bacterium]|nr:MAG: hypothetical protein C7N36_18830 [Bacteroidota bacterium]PTM13161.1 MAG: hypothetical protein DA408_07845 [Bacteroidota bacterium]